MNVSMFALAIGALTALCFGAGLWLLFAALTFLAMLFWGKSRVTGTARRRGSSGIAYVRHEIFLCLFTTFAALAGIVFLYAVNRGIYRWFLIAGMVGGFFLCRRLLSPAAEPVGEKLASGIRAVAFRILVFLSFPFRLICCAITRILSIFLRKIHLHIHSIYDKISVKKYDRKIRAKLTRKTMRELEGLYRSQDV
jgi:hypothetical protein